MTKRKTAKVVQLKNYDHPRIEKNLPIPSPRKTAQHWNFAANMQPGDSFMLDEKRYSKYAHNSFNSWAKEHLSKWTFSSRKVDGGYRVWRIN